MTTHAHEWVQALIVRVVLDEGVPVRRSQKPISIGDVVCWTCGLSPASVDALKRAQFAPCPGPGMGIFSFVVTA